MIVQSLGVLVSCPGLKAHFGYFLSAGKIFPLGIVSLSVEWVYVLRSS